MNPKERKLAPPKEPKPLDSNLIAVFDSVFSHLNGLSGNSSYGINSSHQELIGLLQSSIKQYNVYSDVYIIEDKSRQINLAPKDEIDWSNPIPKFKENNDLHHKCLVCLTASSIDASLFHFTSSNIPRIPRYSNIRFNQSNPETIKDFGSNNLAKLHITIDKESSSYCYSVHLGAKIFTSETFPLTDSSTITKATEFLSQIF